MAQLSAVYASALFDIFVEKEAAQEQAEQGYADRFLEHTVVLRDLLQESDCHRVLVHPHISSAEKRTFFETALGGQIDVDLTGLLYLAITKNREAFLVQAYTDLIGLVERYQKKARAKVISAAELSEEQVESISTMLSRKLNKNVIITAEVDPSLIGGIYIYVDGYYIDRTIKTRLNEMKNNIIKGDGQ